MSCALILAGCGRPPGGPPGGPMGGPMGMTPEVVTMVVTQQPVTLTTELPGRTSPYLIAEIRPQVSGLILKRLFTEGSDVKAGDVLYQIDPAPFQAALANAEAALGRAEANLPALRARAERFKELVAEKAVSQQAYDDAASALRQAEADVQYWKATVENARINLGYTKITSPIAGRIGKSSVTDGAIVTAYQPMALATVQQLDPIYVDVPQSTAELLRLQKRLSEGRLARGGVEQNTVQLLLEDGTPYPHEGTLQFRDVSVDPSTATVILRMVFPNPQGVLLPGMFVRALIKEGVNERAILIPQQAVTSNSKGNPLVMLLGTNGIVEPRPLVIERAVGDKWLVSGGLAPGDRVIVEGLQRIRPGMPAKEAAPGGAPGQGMPPGQMLQPAAKAR
jgi:membrane fusion protein (multidrug efflux system)